jgi:hypothetical protein
METTLDRRRKFFMTLHTPAKYLREGGDMANYRPFLRHGGGERMAELLISYLC